MKGSSDGQRIQASSGRAIGGGRQPRTCSRRLFVESQGEYGDVEPGDNDSRTGGKHCGDFESGGSAEFGSRPAGEFSRAGCGRRQSDVAGLLQQ